MRAPNTVSKPPTPSAATTPLSRRTPCAASRDARTSFIASRTLLSGCLARSCWTRLSWRRRRSGLGRLLRPKNGSCLDKLFGLNE
ncbi:unnamed protein product [Chondrus crispus]|uniref:Uncharacterized protein n=1 Tax=Chondrus crispus TaxID=2769 RepID=R7QMF8_CHOCR|nr:unnamed protein product [Chondrus crispus]CDF38560.1 unnamed protein product [Chondrus crispus]|eukprot:XP_005718453.1 unnamed protein product [Chondrus crispus]